MFHRTLPRALLTALAVLIGLGVLVDSAAAVPSELRFDELPFQPVDGVHFQGVRFGFTIDGEPSTDAYYNSFGPGTLQSVADPSLTGDSRGILTLDFDIPTSQVGFGVALNSGSALTPGFTVELYNELHELLLTAPINTMVSTGALGFSEASYAYDGAAVSRVVVDFADAPGSFAFDNLTYIVPEPSTGSLALIAVVLVTAANLARRNRTF